MSVEKSYGSYVSVSGGKGRKSYDLLSNILLLAILKFKNRIIVGRTIGISGGRYTIEEIAQLLSKHCSPAVIKDGKVRNKRKLATLAFLYHSTEKYQRVKNHFWWRILISDFA